MLPSPTPPSAVASRVGTLDTLRGIAIAMVVAFHVSVAIPLPGRAGAWLTLGNLGVQLFFIISAVTMGLMWRQREGEDHRRLRFFIRRFFRLAPMFWLTALVYVACGKVAGVAWPLDADGWRRLLLTLSFLHGFSPEAINLVVPGGWSIAVEMSFYALFPWLAARLQTPGQALLAGFAAYLVLGLAASNWGLQAGWPAIFVYYSMLTQLPVFLLGMGVYRWLERGQGTMARPEALTWLSLAAAWLLLAFALKYATELTARPFFWLQVMALAIAVCAAMRRRWQWPPLSFLGTCSYSLYLLHFAVIDGLQLVWPQAWRQGGASYLAFLGATLLVGTALANLSKHSLERLSTRMGQWVIRRVAA